MEIRKYELGINTAYYLISPEGKVSLLLLPKGSEYLLAKNWELPRGEWGTRLDHVRDWRIGNLVQLHLSHHRRSRGNGETQKYSQSTGDLKFKNQDFSETETDIRIITTLCAPNYEVKHTLVWEKDCKALWCETEFLNTGNENVTLEMLSSFCLENLSPFQLDHDQTGKINLHRFLGGWAMEGKHICTSMEDLGLQKAWANAFTEGERFGSIGSWTCHKYFPTAAVEDTEHHILWGVSLETPSSWQMELTRDGDTLSFSGGIADGDFGAFEKDIAPGQSFVSPRARIATAHGDYQDVCQNLLDLQNRRYKEVTVEEGLPICFNEYCSSWGNPLQDKELQYAKILENKGVTYFVIDAGWSVGSHEQWGNGEWELDQDRFPDMESFCKQIRGMGMVPGIWFELEATTEGSKVYGPDFDHMHLQRRGNVITFGYDRTFWDFRNPETVKYLEERVIDFLKKYDLGYLKIDYNGNIGLGCDGAESLGEGLRLQMEAVQKFLRLMKEKLPNLVIENCASGGHRLEASMMSLTDVSSFSDCHEANEIPVIAGNVQSLCIPQQNLIWAVLRDTDTEDRLYYSLISGLLGRLCLSGDIENLNEKQWEIVERGLQFYKSVESVLEKGKTRVYQTNDTCVRHPKGIQVVTRIGENQMLLVYHGFEDSEAEITIPLDGDYLIKGEYGKVNYEINRQCHEVKIRGLAPWTAGALWMVKN